MKLVTDRQAVLEVLDEARQAQRPLFTPNAETTPEMEGILLGAQRFAERTGAKSIAVGIGVTSCYPDHPQLGRLAMNARAVDSQVRPDVSYEAVRAALQVWRGWLAVYENHPAFSRVRAVPFLDHGWAALEADRQLMEDLQVQDWLGIIMYDASAGEIDENIRATRGYVERAGQRVVVEACPDKVYEQAEVERRGLRAADMLTDPAQADRFVRETGVDLLVPNLGTEHRSAAGDRARYHGDVARALQEKVGAKLALHGTSSVSKKLGALGADGIVKVNYYTAMGRRSAQAIRESWQKFGDDPLPIANACGSWEHLVRRQEIADACEAMLDQLAEPA